MRELIVSPNEINPPTEHYIDVSGLGLPSVVKHLVDACEVVWPAGADTVCV
ncbi:hypothetical protein AURDEDRAFT_160609 [Auricularia subglabra TFB-10046 SS5]|nr:hypothetical protein AURDEDRAFT_160609 [Auricularia subglabra TFB-10046 SS5]